MPEPEYAPVNVNVAEPEVGRQFAIEITTSLKTTETDEVTGAEIEFVIVPVMVLVRAEDAALVAMVAVPEMAWV